MSNIIQQERITFYESNHTYKVGGKTVPSVTKIIRHFEPNYFYKDTGAKERGIVVHRLLEDYDNGLDTSFYGDEYLLFLDHYKKMLADIGMSFTGKEVKTFNREYWYAGMIDRVGFNENRDLIADIKTGTSVPSTTAIQTAAYAMAYYKNPYDVCRIAIHINPYKRKTYRLHIYDDKNDFLKWQKWCKQYSEEMRGL